MTALRKKYSDKRTSDILWTPMIAELRNLGLIHVKDEVLRRFRLHEDFRLPINDKLMMEFKISFFNDEED